ncbi:MAG: ATP-grasp domain-containing protein [Bacteroidales bacterium]|nr:ATP-grasp domain-containing protein [Bacteroidales bacterium]
MILLDGPYVSDFLKDTIEEFEIQVVETEFAKNALLNKKVKFIPELEAIEQIRKKPDSKLYTNSENSISWVEQNLSFSHFPENIRFFKNKIAFRELLKPIFPDFFFQKVDFDKIDDFDISNCQFPFILKPAVGFFSIGVYRIDSAEEWTETVKNIKAEIHQTRNDYPLEVVNASELIIEQVIEGNEYAFDCYFDANGEPVVFGILHHVFTSGKDVSDRIYSSSKEIILSLKPKIEVFLNEIGKLTGLKNFPLHIEIRVGDDGIVRPIEINPLRFGGWCTTADLTWFAFGFNPYIYFLSGKKPNWDEILKDKDNFIYSLILLDNNSGIPADEIDSFNYEKILSDFQNPLHLRKVDYTKFPIFGFLFAETNKNDVKELQTILHSDLKNYINKK